MQFRKANIKEVQEVFNIILSRITWMDETGIKQWNVTDYANAYPLSYYEEQCNAGRLYVLVDDVILAAAVLLETDERWDDEANAFYIHNFASRSDYKGSGSIFLDYAESYALSENKEYMRLDCAKDNDGILRYYHNRGYVNSGSCKEGLYIGILQQKKLGRN